MNTNAVLTAGATNAPRKQVTAQGVVVRYGFKPMGDSGYARYVEHVFRKMPDKTTLQNIVETYNAENGINEEFAPSDYGFQD